MLTIANIYKYIYANKTNAIHLLIVCKKYFVATCASFVWNSCRLMTCELVIQGVFQADRLEERTLQLLWFFGWIFGRFACVESCLMRITDKDNFTDNDRFRVPRLSRHTVFSFYSPQHTQKIRKLSWIDWTSAAFYHVPQDTDVQYHCLTDKCKIHEPINEKDGRHTNTSSLWTPPKTVIAVVKFEADGYSFHEGTPTAMQETGMQKNILNWTLKV